MADADTASTPESTDPLKQLIQTIKAEFQRGKLKVPSLPEVAFRIRNTLNDERKSAFQIAKVLQLDPVIASRVIQVANSPLYRTSNKIQDCHTAISRIGLGATRNLVTSLIVQQVYGARNPVIRKALKDNWRHCAKVAAIAYVLGRITPGITPDKVLLGGLVHEIGLLPILRYAEGCPEALENMPRFNAATEKIQGKLGALVLKSWGMDEQLREIPLQIGNADYDCGEAISTVDIVVVAHFHNDYIEGRVSDLEFLAEVNSFKKLPISQFGSDASLEVIESAKEEIGHIMSFVSA